MGVLHTEGIDHHDVLRPYGWREHLGDRRRKRGRVGAACHEHAGAHSAKMLGGKQRQIGRGGAVDAAVGILPHRRATEVPGQIGGAPARIDTVQIYPGLTFDGITKAAKRVGFGAPCPIEASYMSVRVQHCPTQPSSPKVLYPNNV
jgi:hypothetical protein